jgi:hypothetical protein
MRAITIIKGWDLVCFSPLLVQGPAPRQVISQVSVQLLHPLPHIPVMPPLHHIRIRIFHPQRVAGKRFNFIIEISPLVIWALTLEVRALFPSIARQVPHFRNIRTLTPFHASRATQSSSPRYS